MWSFDGHPHWNRPEKRRSGSRSKELWELLSTHGESTHATGLKDEIFHNIHIHEPNSLKHAKSVIQTTIQKCFIYLFYRHSFKQEVPRVHCLGFTICTMHATRAVTLHLLHQQSPLQHGIGCDDGLSGRTQVDHTAWRGCCGGHSYRPVS